LFFNINDSFFRKLYNFKKNSILLLKLKKILFYFLFISCFLLLFSPDVKKKIQEFQHPESSLKSDKTCTNSLDMKFVLIKAGSFYMGSSENEPGRELNEKSFPVTITKDFYLQTTEVTKEQWKRVMGDVPSNNKYCLNQCPVDSFFYNEINIFLEILNKMEKTNKYRIPTEAEWEYAARAGTKTAFSNGNINELYCQLDSNLEKIGWYCGNSEGRLHPVAQKKPNAWGLYDMHGNLWEWCQDWYGKYPMKHVIDPKGAKKGSYIVIRGGSWFSDSRNCRSAFRTYWPYSSRGYGVGFRVLKEL